MNQIKGRILDVVSRWPGSAHDSTIFTSSNLCHRLRRGDFGYDSAILCDSAYPPERFICKPLRENVIRTEREENYQTYQIRARNVAERVNGQLKRRFPALKYGMYSIIFYFLHLNVININTLNLTFNQV